MEQLHYWNIGAIYQSKNGTQGNCDMRLTTHEKQIGAMSLATARDEIGGGDISVVISHISYLGYMTEEEYEES